LLRKDREPRIPALGRHGLGRDDKGEETRELSVAMTKRIAKGEDRTAAGSGPPNSGLAVLKFPKQDSREKVLD